MASRSTWPVSVWRCAALAALTLAAGGCGHMMHARPGGMAGMDAAAMSGCCCMAGGHGMQHGGEAHGSTMPQAGKGAGGMASSSAHGIGMPAMPGTSRYLPQQTASAGPMCGAGGSSCCGGSAGGGCCGSTDGAAKQPPGTK